MLDRTDRRGLCLAGSFVPGRQPSIVFPPSSAQHCTPLQPCGRHGKVRTFSCMLNAHTPSQGLRRAVPTLDNPKQMAVRPPARAFFRAQLILPPLIRHFLQQPPWQMPRSPAKRTTRTAAFTARDPADIISSPEKTQPAPKVRILLS